jgi:SAM-dependent methyltransferase
VTESHGNTDERDSVNTPVFSVEDRLVDQRPVAREVSPLPVRSVLRVLLDQADPGALRASFPELTEDELRECFIAARTLTGEPKSVQRRKGARQTTVVRTHGLPAADGRMHKGNIFRAFLSPLRPGRLLDLGAGKGNYSLAAAELGWQVTAVDARTVRWPRAKPGLNPSLAAMIESIRWVQADIRDFPIAAGDYDLICVLGLLHHLEIPDQIALLRRCAGTLLLLDTRIAPAIVDVEGPYSGMLVREHGETRAERDLVPTAAWGNAVSFRHTEDSLIQLVRNSGYAQIMPMRPPHRRDYTFYLCWPHVSRDGPWSQRRNVKHSLPPQE